MNKYTKLILCILLDVLGYLSYILPGIGEFADIVWAPLSAWIMTSLFKGTSGKVAAVINFIEEAFPGLDIIPTFTIMWLYTYLFSKQNT